jgi:hypothetical protein
MRSGRVSDGRSLVHAILYRAIQPSSSPNTTGRSLPGDPGGEGQLPDQADVRTAGGVSLGLLQIAQIFDKAVPAELDVHLVCDNLATHKTPAIRDWLTKHPRFTLHFAPTGSSWINRARFRGPARPEVSPRTRRRTWPSGSLVPCRELRGHEMPARAPGPLSGGRCRRCGRIDRRGNSYQ